VSFLTSLVGALFSSLFQAVASAWADDRQRADTASAHERAGAAEAANETQQAIAETADARASLPSEPDDPDSLASSLRRRRAAADRGGQGRDGAGDA
jgi:hypothetical protein